MYVYVYHRCRWPRRLKQTFDQFDRHLSHNFDQLLERAIRVCYTPIDRASILQHIYTDIRTWLKLFCSISSTEQIWNYSNSRYKGSWFEHTDALIGDSYEYHIMHNISLIMSQVLILYIRPSRTVVWGDIGSLVYQDAALGRSRQSCGPADHRVRLSNMSIV